MIAGASPGGWRRRTHETKHAAEKKKNDRSVTWPPITSSEIRPSLAPSHITWGKEAATAGSNKLTVRPVEATGTYGPGGKFEGDSVLRDPRGTGTGLLHSLPFPAHFFVASLQLASTDPEAGWGILAPATAKEGAGRSEAMRLSEGRNEATNLRRPATTTACGASASPSREGALG